MPWTCTHCESINSDDARFCDICDNTKGTSTRTYIAIAAGAHHNLALTASGNVIAWGDNTHGQCTVPTHVTDIIAVAAGSQHSLALSKHGIIYAWGSNVDGQCTLPARLTTATHIYAGGDVSAALCDGAPLLWGRIIDGHCEIPALCTDVTLMAVGRAHTLALTTSGKLFAWGKHESTIADVSNLYAAPGNNITSRFLEKIQFWKVAPPKKPSSCDVIGIACTDTHSVVLTSDGLITRWNADGLLPKLHQANLRTITAAEAWIAGITSAGEALLWVHDTLTTLPFTEPIDQIALGETHAIARSRSGNIMLWGSGTHGQTTLPAELLHAHLKADSSEAKKPLVPRFDTSRTRAVATVSDGEKPSMRHTFKIVPSERSSDDTTPSIEYSHVETKVSSTATVPARRPVWVCSVCETNNLGSNLHCDVCNEPCPAETKTAHTSVASPTTPFSPILVAGFSHVSMLLINGRMHTWGVNPDTSASDADIVLLGVSISSKADHTLLLKSDGTILGWGRNGAGQTAIPKTLSHVSAIAAGGSHSLALQDGCVVGWGGNKEGQINIPPELSNVKLIAAGWNHSLALLENGIVMGWGENSAGQATPPTILDEVHALSAGMHHSVALRTDGTVVVWGSNRVHQTEAPKLSVRITAISAGWNHTLALLADGTVVAWGANKYGQCRVPPSLDNVIALAAGVNYSVAFTADGRIHSWGRDDRPQTSKVFVLD